MLTLLANRCVVGQNKRMGLTTESIISASRLSGGFLGLSGAPSRVYHQHHHATPYDGRSISGTIPPLFHYPDGQAALDGHESGTRLLVCNVISRGGQRLPQYRPRQWLRLAVRAG